MTSPTHTTEDTRSGFDFAEGEILLLDKPLGWTSFDVVNKIKYALKPLKVKVGHAGTLDPLATGLLVICTGRFTKRIDEFQAQEKEYTGTFTLGATTPSYDLETQVNAHFPTAHIDDDLIRRTATAFIGEIEQQPPAHSAVKIDGERSYEKARRGEQVITRRRVITISDVEITRIALPEADFRVICSKGTYIRSLAYDFGRALDSGAYLSKLRRTRSGSFRVDDAWQIDDLIREIKKGK